MILIIPYCCFTVCDYQTLHSPWHLGDTLRASGRVHLVTPPETHRPCDILCGSAWLWLSKRFIYPSWEIPVLLKLTLDICHLWLDYNWLSIQRQPHADSTLDTILCCSRRFLDLFLLPCTFDGTLPRAVRLLKFNYLKKEWDILNVMQYINTNCSRGSLSVLSFIPMAYSPFSPVC